MTSSASITKRLTLAVLLLEFVAALVLIATVFNHERHVQFTVFMTNLRASASALFGALQEADSNDANIALDTRGLSLPPRAIYSVSDSIEGVLGTQGQVPLITAAPGTFTESKVGGRAYLFYVLTGERAIDPGKPFAVIHHVRIVFGLPIGRVWHEIIEAVRFFAIATIVLLGITAWLLTWLIRRFLLPIWQLAVEADNINTDNWVFNAPASSKRFVELRPLASAIETSVLRLQHSFEKQRRFTSDAAHELKTDLAIVKSSLQLLQMKRRTVEEYEHGLSLGLNDIGRLEATVQKMLTLARLEQTPKNDAQTCDLTEAVYEAISQSQPFAEIKQVPVMHDLQVRDAIVPVGKEDAILLCSNVLVNALQHSPLHGRVDVTMALNAGSISLQVRDQGEGIKQEDQPFLFDAFYRGDESRSRKTGGTGLGLSICKAICDRSGGSISIANHPGGGAIVEITLPAVRKDHAEGRST
ncbi:MAG: HAMP domain-containing sensor histidine kinase [Edaphobacter sp.]|uniref:sensor histidine kinase n=1 Tax=Edaphobacter sp. TaxID=1934404 RepID=UPI00239D69BF|nr:HAMP domain-containing sensor histidine kinase [Edaphobacter sp.]MDE1178001.1 HAMP domain-containing sensor histidine kinase [Edaphobacter sp.]